MTFGDILKGFAGGLTPDARLTDARIAALQQEMAQRDQALQSNLRTDRLQQRSLFQQMQAFGQEEPLRLQNLADINAQNAIKMQADREELRRQLADQQADNDLGATLGLNPRQTALAKRKFDLRDLAKDVRTKDLNIQSLARAQEEANMTPYDKGKREAENLWGMLNGMKSNPFSSPDDVQDAIAAQGKLDAVEASLELDKVKAIDDAISSLPSIGAAYGMDVSGMDPHDLFTSGEKKDAAALLDAFLNKGLSQQEAMGRVSNKLIRLAASRHAPSFNKANALGPQMNSMSPMGQDQIDALSPAPKGPGFMETYLPMTNDIINYQPPDTFMGRNFPFASSVYAEGVKPMGSKLIDLLRDAVR